MRNLFDNNKAAPFDDIVSKPQVEQTDASSGAFVASRDGFTFRGSVFTVMNIISFCFLFTYCSDVVQTSLFVIAYLVVWSFTCRFFERKSLVSVNLLINVLLALAPCAIWNNYFDVTSFYSFLPLVLGVTVLASCPSDGRQQFSRYPLSLFYMHMLISLTAAAVAEVAALVIRASYLSVRLIIAAFVVWGISYAESRITGSNILLSGRALTGSAKLPKRDVSMLNTFISGRLVYAGITLVAFALAMAATYFLADKIDVNPVYIRALATTVTFAVYSAVQTEKKMPFESFIAIVIISWSESLVSYLLVIAIDVVFKGYMTITRRKSIFHTRNKYADGIPLLLVTIAIFVLAVECCF